MEGFTVSMALFDAVPVLLFGGSMILAGLKFRHPLFILGAVLSTLAGCMKVTWKLIIGLKKKDLRWLDRPFVPMQAAGFLLMLSSVLLSVKKIPWAGVWSAVSSLPAAALYALWIIMLGGMVWYKKNRFKKYSDKTNWTAEVMNTLAQGALFLAILLSR